MEINNMMNISPKATDSARRTSAGARSTGAGGKSGFGDILSGTEGVDELNSDGLSAWDAGADADELSSPQGDAPPKDPLAAALAATQQGSMAITEGILPTVSDDIVGESAKIGAIEDIGLELGQNDFPLPTENKNILQPNLQAILPQSAEIAGKNRRMLDMLAGTALPAESVDESTAQVGRQPFPTEAKLVGMKQPTGTVLPLTDVNNFATAKGEIAAATGANQSTVLPQSGNPVPLTEAFALQDQAGTTVGNDQRILFNATERTITTQNADGDLPMASLVRQTMPLPNNGETRLSRPGNDLLGRFGVDVLAETVSGGAVAEATLSSKDFSSFDRRDFGANLSQAADEFLSRSSDETMPTARFVLNDGAEMPVAPQAQSQSNTPAPAPAVPLSANMPAPTENAAPANNPPPAPPTADYEIPQQIVEQARLLRRGTDTEMVIKLKPEHLGDLTLRVSVAQNGSVNASFHSDNAQVRLIIENSLVQLKQELADQGIKVDKVEVYTGLADGQMPQGQGQYAWQRGDGDNNGQIGNQNAALESFEEASENMVADTPGVATAEGVDYRV